MRPSGVTSVTDAAAQGRRPLHPLQLHPFQLHPLHPLQARPHKIVVFFVTARLTQLYARAYSDLDLEVLEMHSRLSQSKRTNTAERFRVGERT